MANEECSAPDSRLLDQPTENSQFWKAINFAATIKASSPDTVSAPLEERAELVKFLLNEADALPNEENALHDCREKIQQNFPHFLPLFLRVEDETRYKEEYDEAQELYFKVNPLVGDPSRLRLIQESNAAVNCFTARCSSWTIATLCFKTRRASKTIQAVSRCTRHSSTRNGSESCH